MSANVYKKERKNMKKFLLSAIIVIALILPSLSFGYSKIVSFGDSLSDTGNVLAATAGAHPNEPAYFPGRFSNGPVWVEFLADNIGADLENYAWGGATTAGYSGGIPGLDIQVASFLGSGPSFGNDTLFTVWAGPNDFFQGATAPVPSVDNIIMAVQALEDAGAKHILVPNMPDLGITPGALSLSLAEQAGLSTLTGLFNSYLHDELTALMGGGFGAALYEMDVQSILQSIIASSTFDNNTQAAYPALGLTAWAAAGDYLFWDDVHPTTAAHKLVADYAALAVPENASVPVPGAVWLLGSGLIFMAGIRRGKK